MREIWMDILEGQQVRQNLSTLRQQAKQAQDREAFFASLEDAANRLPLLLGHEDAKTRKNAALLMGEWGVQAFLSPLYLAYQREQQLFVKGAYLTALKNLDYREYVQDFETELKKLTTTPVDQESEKHVEEQIRLLTDLVVTLQGSKSHVFTGWDQSHDVILLTNRNFPHLVQEQLMQLDPGCKCQPFTAGVRARVTHLHWINQIRTYQEFLFVVPGLLTCHTDAQKAGKAIAASGLLRYLQNNHRGDGPFYFRVEMKSRMEQGKRGAFLRKLTAALEQASDRKLINSTSHYEMEIRLIENKEEQFHVLLKLSTIQDERFLYRSQHTALSIRPVNGALTVYLAKEYLKPEAQVLDPFCGVGTMLIERHKAVPANTTYGIDILEEAIEKARINTPRAGQLIHYINRDFFDFTHQYLFDEIITDMPFAMGRLSKDQIVTLYKQFFQKAVQVLTPDGMVILYTRDRDLVKAYCKPSFVTVKEYQISMKEKTWVCILRRS